MTLNTKPPDSRDTLVFGRLFLKNNHIFKKAESDVFAVDAERRGDNVIVVGNPAEGGAEFDQSTDQGVFVGDGLEVFLLRGVRQRGSHGDGDNDQ